MLEIVLVALQSLCPPERGELCLQEQFDGVIGVDSAFSIRST